MSVAERRQREREERRHRILDAAERVFYARGLEQATMDEVARAAQLGKGTLYLYFRTKEELLLAIAVRRQDAMLERFQREERAASSGIDLVRRLLLTYAERMATPREHLRLVLGRWASGVAFGAQSDAGAQAHANVERLLGTMCRAIERGQADGTIRRAHDPRRLTMKLHAGVNGALLMQLQMACLAGLAPLPAPTVEDEVDLLLDAIRPPAATVMVTGRASAARRAGGRP
jgi:AcrR family transcriptional regulator